MREGDTVLRAGTRQAHDVLGADIRSENRSAYDPPGQIAPGQKVVRGSVLAFAYDPRGDAQQDAEVQADCQPIIAAECVRAHARFFICLKAANVTVTLTRTDSR